MSYEDRIRHERSNMSKSFARLADFLLDSYVEAAFMTASELAYTLDALCQDNKRVVFTGTHFPKDIPKLKSRLQSRLAGGMVTHIEPPDFETRLKILEKKAAHEAIHLPGDVADLLAHTITRDVRQLESAVIGIAAVIAVYIGAGVFAAPFTAYLLPVTWIALGGTLVESLPFKDIDNVTLTVVSAIIGYFVF